MQVSFWPSFGFPGGTGVGAGVLGGSESKEKNTAHLAFGIDHIQCFCCGENSIDKKEF